MPNLILVRHSQPNVKRTTHANSGANGSSPGALSAEGRARCYPLAEQIMAYRPAAVITSGDAKAAETAQIIAERLHLPCAPAADLHEHERNTIPQINNKAEYNHYVEGFFAQANRLVFGDETADEVYRRFSRAIDRVLRTYHYETLVVVTHSAVMSLFIARHAAIDPFPLWQSLGLPSFAVLSLPGCNLLRLVEHVSATQPA